MIILIVTTTSTGLIAGLFYAYTCSVNPGLGKLPDKEYLAAMQSINRAILNPVFLSTFAGTLLLLPLSTWLSYTKPASSSFILMLISALVYAVGVFGVTMFGNVPLNEVLDKFNLGSASAEEISTQRAMFEAPWNWLHNIRTLGALISLVLAVAACIFHSK